MTCSRAALLASLSLLSLVIATGCVAGSTDPSASQNKDGATHAGSPAPAACCPPDKFLSGSMYLGGAKEPDGSCYKTSDFACSRDWRIEKDDAGCDVWRYDVATPGPGEDRQCHPLPQASP
jgi:hypothetical protein